MKHTKDFAQTLRYSMAMALLRRTTAATLTIWLFGTYPLEAWWETGHQVTARLAAAHLTPSARTRVARILGVPDSVDAVVEALSRASTWADETKNVTGTGSWHFIDLALQDRRSDIPARCPHGDCAPVRIKMFVAELASGRPTARWSELDALRYVVHLVGDIHQPMHTVSDADLGGNCERLREPIDQARNLHALWDGALVDALNPNAAALTADLERYIAALGAGEAAALVRGRVEDWVWESHEIAVRNVYGKLHIPVEPVEFPTSCREAPLAITEFHPQIDSLYIDMMKPVVRDQLVKGGLRLARVLNEAL